MMLADIVRFEWRYHTRQMSFAAAAILFLVFGFAMTAAAFGPANVAVNSPYSVMQTVGVLSLLSLFVLAVFCANAIVRDNEYRMEEIVFSTAVEKAPFLAGRFGGAFLAANSAFVFSLLGMIAALFAAGHDPSRVAALRVSSYLWAFLVLALPNLLFATVVIFVISALTRSLLAGSVGAVLIYVIYLAVAALTNSPLMASSVAGAADAPSLAPLLDPFGLSPFFKMTQHWTAAERNARLLPLTGIFLANRVLWIGVSAAALALLYRRFAFRLLNSGSTKRGRVLPTTEQESPTREPAIAYAPVTASDTTRTQFAAFLSATRLEIRSFVRTLPFLALTILWAALALSEIAAAIDSVEYGAKLYPTSPLVLASIQQALQLLALIILVYFSAEVVWRERTLRMSGIIHATPTTSAVFVLSKWTALTALVAILIAVGTLASVVSQLIRGWNDVNPIAIIGYAWFGALPLLIFAVVAILVHALAPNKYLGMVITAALAIVMRAGDLGALGHPLLRFGSGPPVSWSDFYGFGPATIAFHWFMLHWSLFGALALVMATGAARAARSSVLGPRSPVVVVPGLVLGIAVSSAHLFYRTNIVNEYESSRESREWRADYERMYGTFQALPQPRVVAVHAAVDLHPDENRYRLRGTLTLRNETGQPIPRVLISTRRDAHDAKLTLAGATLAERNPRFHHSWFTLDPPLAPSDSRALDFDLTFISNGFEQGGFDTAIVPDGSVVMSSQVMPVIGYREGYRLRDPIERRRAGLPALPDAVAGDVAIAQEWVDLDLTLSTPADQLGVTSGRMTSEWEQHGRRYRRFQSDAPIPFGFAFASARYAVARESHGDIVVEIYHHPAHAENVPRMMRAARVSLEQFTRMFGPYRHRVLKIVETPAPGRSFGGYALPDMVLLQENRSFLIDARDEMRVDLVSRRAAHEIAHQWWGRHVTPALEEGAPFLTESVTKYAEMLVLEAIYGEELTRRAMANELDLYLTGRTRDTAAEVPLVRAGAQGYLAYAKGALVMNALRDLLGSSSLNQTLRSFIAEEGGPGKAPTAAQLVERLMRTATPEQQARIDEWMHRIVLYDLRLESATARGRETTMTIAAAKSEDGKVLPFDEETEIALYAADSDRPIYRGKHRLHSGLNTIAVVSEQTAAVAAVDPFVLRIDRNRFDNVREIEAP